MVRYFFNIRDGEKLEKDVEGVNRHRNGGLTQSR